MKYFIRSILCFLMVLSFLVTTPIRAVYAATNEATVKTITVKSTKVNSKYMNKYQYDMDSIIYDSASSTDYYISVRNTDDDKYVLTCTKDGKTYKEIVLKDLVMDTIGKELNDPWSITVNLIDGVFYLVGNYFEDDICQYFYLSTTDGKTFDSGKLVNIPANEYWYFRGHLFKAGSTFIFAFGDSENDLKICRGDQSFFYTSTDLATWKEASFPIKSKDAVWRLDAVTDEGVIVSKCGERSYNEMNHWYSMQMYYTTDFKKYTKLDSDLSYKNPEAYVRSFSDDSGVIRDEYIHNKEMTKFLKYKLYISNDMKALTNIFEYDESKQESKTLSFNKYCTKKKLSIFIEKEKGNSLFIYSKKDNVFKEYNYSLKTSLFGGGVFDEKDEYTYLVYDKKYLLVSKDGFKTTYKICTPLKYIHELVLVGDVIALQGEESAYYLKLSDIKTAMK